MIQIFYILLFAALIILLNIFLAMFVVPRAIRMMRTLLRGELFLSVMEMFVTIFILGYATFYVIFVFI